MADFVIKRGNTRPIFSAVLMNNVGKPKETPVDLTKAKTVYLIVRPYGTEGAATAPTLKVKCEIEKAEKPEKGEVQYIWQPGDLDIPADLYVLEVEVEFEDGGKETFPPEGYNTLEVWQSLNTGPGITRHILTLEEYKQLRRITDENEARDAQIEMSLSIAEDVIVEYTKRLFTQEPTHETRKYRYDGSSVLDIEDCNNITNVVLANRALVEDVDWHAGPEHGRTIFWLDFSWRGQLPAYSIGQMGFTSNMDKLGSFGRDSVPFVFVEVTADFGWPVAAIPSTIKQAAAWLVDEMAVKRVEAPEGGGQVSAEAIADLSYSYQVEAAAVIADIPPRIRALLDLYSRPEL